MPEDQLNRQRRIQLGSPDAGPQPDFKSPVMRYVMQLPAQVTIQSPRLEDLSGAYQAGELTLPESARKQKKLLEGCKERFTLQTDLASKVFDLRRNPAKYADRKAIALKDAVSLSDKEIVKKFGKIKTDKGYFVKRYFLMKNKYYTLFPPEEMRKVARDELIFRLRKLYAAPDDRKDEDLIRYYQTLIEVRDLEDEASAEKEGEFAPNAEYLTEEEEVKNLQAQAKNEQILDKSHIPADIRQIRKERMDAILNPADSKEFLEEGELKVTGEQKEGIRQILAWMYRNCNKSSESKEPFVYKLTQLPPEKIMLAFYMVEHKLDHGPTAGGCYSVVNGYVPNLAAFKDKVIASRWKFWKRIGTDSSDSVINWSMIGSAVRQATGNEDVVNLAKFSKKVEEAGEGADDPQLTPVEKRDKLLDLLQQKGNLLLSIYRSANLHPDMPTSMIKDRTLRARAEELLADIGTHVQDITDITRALPADQRTVLKARYAKKRSDKVPGDAPEEEEDEDSSAAEVLDDVRLVTDVSGNFDDAMVLLGDTVSAMMENKAYGSIIGGLDGISGVVGIISSIIAMRGLDVAGSGLTFADHLSQGLSVAGDFVDSIATGANGIMDIVAKLGNYAERFSNPAQGWLGETTLQSIGDTFSTATGGVQFCAGCTSMLAGLAQTIAGGIKYGSAVSSEHDVARSRKKLEEKDQSALTEEEKTLRDFLKHQDRAMEDQRVSSMVKMAGGVLQMAGGFMLATGLLAPIGGIISLAGSLVNIGLGMIYCRKRRNLTRKQAVDDSLKIDEAVDMVRSTNPDVSRLSDAELKDYVRQEALAELGYASYQECFADISLKNAQLLYDKVFNMDTSDPDWKMYYDALQSVGLKIKMPQNGQKPSPTVKMIYARLME